MHYDKQQPYQSYTSAIKNLFYTTALLGLSFDPHI